MNFYIDKARDKKGLPLIVHAIARVITDEGEFIRVRRSPIHRTYDVRPDELYDKYFEFRGNGKRAYGLTRTFDSHYELHFQDLPEIITVSTIYIDRHGQRITKDTWVASQQVDAMKYIRRYSNGKMAIDAVWSGVIRDADKNPKENWCPFELQVFNILPSGKAVPDPILSTAFAKTEEEVIRYYEELLTSEGLGGIEQDYEGNESFVEIGNLYDLQGGGVVTEAQPEEEEGVVMEAPERIQRGSW